MCLCVYVLICLCVYVFMFVCLCRFMLVLCVTANLPTNIMDFRGFDSRIILILRGGILMSVHREFPGKFESSNLSRDNVSREIGRSIIY